MEVAKIEIKDVLPNQIIVWGISSPEIVLENKEIGKHLVKITTKNSKEEVMERTFKKTTQIVILF